MEGIPLPHPAFPGHPLFAAVSNWNNFVGPMLFITSPEKYPLQYLIQQLLSDVSGIYASASDTIIPQQTLKYAAVILGSLPMILLYPLLQKYYINGMVMGGVKE